VIILGIFVMRVAVTVARARVTITHRAVGRRPVGHRRSRADAVKERPAPLRRI
jgi:hypothetical protein